MYISYWLIKPSWWFCFRGWQWHRQGSVSEICHWRGICNSGWPQWRISQSDLGTPVTWPQRSGSHGSWGGRVIKGQCGEPSDKYSGMTDTCLLFMVSSAALRGWIINQNVLLQCRYFQPASVCVNAAGITQDEFLLKMEEDDFDKVIEVNLKVPQSRV